MAITSLERAALTKSAEFQEQVDTIVIREALYKNQTPPAPLDNVQQDALTRVINNPGGYAFVGTITADAAWALKYDVWAADPAAQDGVISAAVNTHFSVLTGYWPPAPEAEVTEPS